MAFITPSLPLFRGNAPSLRAHFRMSSLPPRLVKTPLPNLYVYDHCPFSCRVRFILGHKNIKHNLIWLANDDVETPVSFVGKKMVPIFQPDGIHGVSLAESLDIVTAIDADPKFGAGPVLKPASARTDIEQWFDDVEMPMKRLTFVRMIRAPLPEFLFSDARDSFLGRHMLKDPESYDENFARSGDYIKEIAAKLGELEDMVWSKEYCTEGGLSVDDVTLFPRIRTLTFVKDLVLPKKLRQYAEYHSERTEVPLYDYCAA